jgi:hypothetical protein
MPVKGKKTWLQNETLLSIAGIICVKGNAARRSVNSVGYANTLHKKTEAPAGSRSY